MVQVGRTSRHFLVIISFIRESSLPALTSQLYYPQSPILRGIVSNRKWNMTLLYTSTREEKLTTVFFPTFTLEQNEEFDQAKKKKVLSYLLKS